MLLYSAKMHVQLMEMFQEGSQRRSLGHLSKSIDILGEALATVAELAVRTGDIGVGVVDIAGQQYTSMHLAPIGSQKR